MKSLQRIFAVVMKEVRQLRRDRLTFGMIIGIPTMQLLLFGFAINFDVRNLPAGVVDLSGSAASRGYVMQMANAQVIDIQHQAADARELEQLMRQGKISVGIFIPHDFERRLQQPERAAVQLLVDGSDTVVQAAATRLAAAARTSPYNDAPPPSEIRTYYNPERRSAVNTVPGLIGVILTMTMTMFTAVAIVRERERGNLELLITTPVRSSELMLAKILPYVLIGLVQVVLILLLGKWVFQVPFRGTLGNVFLVSLMFIVANLALGLVVSTIAQTQFQAMQMTFFILLPSILLSGFVFPFAGMPLVAQWIAEVLPMTHFMRLIRGVILRGASLQELSGELAILGVFIAVSMTLAVARFHKRLD
ncbi:MAG: ABC transporter permease [Xanthomonadales bacterium]|nr:ABC transporter permease [Gammaproteobacteria bacterium]MBT8051639.1 ABC transporter permease [Gammaproteobacteria bacterium]MBT8057664.1 ABC transporter permease [Gammaproteobacteria bacterium]NNJ77744.1 ABC transporter permease [Xanthomonadales bacterium]NNL04947.1 ABC transporter permease [Xanthomonadales bacterium]